MINGPLKEKWNNTVKEASQRLYANGVLDNGGQLPAGTTSGSQPQAGAKFESNLEDFYATLDQIEVVLRCAIESQQQAQSSNRYMQIPPQPARLENMQNPEEYLSYPQYISIAKQQVQYANNIKEMILQATTDVVEQRHTLPTAQQQAQQAQQQAQQQQQQQAQQAQQLQQQAQSQSPMNQGPSSIVPSTPMNPATSMPMSQPTNIMPTPMNQPTSMPNPMPMSQPTNMPVSQPSGMSMSQSNLMNPQQQQMNF